MSVSFGTKAETLEKLRSLVKCAKVLPQMCFTVKDWNNQSVQLLESIVSEFSKSGEQVIVRSSALTEDAQESSQAGHFESVLGVELKDKKKLGEAIERVIGSFGVEGADENQVFVQPMVEDVDMSGVLFTRDLDALAPYFVINYDDQSSRTDTVTSGHSNQLKTKVRYRNAPGSAGKFESLLKAVAELETFFETDKLDVEFVVNKSGEVFLLQVRPLAITTDSLMSYDDIGLYLEKLSKKIEKINAPHPYLYGKRTILGVMPDWNPAEMLGVKPRPLALSLYKELITDRTWAYQRDNYGYKNLRSYPLMVSLIGHPYIDVRVSFNSFIPKDLNDDLSGRLCDYYLDQLIESPESHDKVEFDILFSCYFLGLDKKLEKLHEVNFSKQDTESIRTALLNLTNEILKPEESVFYKDLEKIEELVQRQEKISSSSLTELEKIYWLIEDCRRYGTLPFAGLARGGFVAAQMLQSLVDVGIMSPEDLERYMGSLNTVAKKMDRDRGKVSKDEFLEVYGHLRPGTYDILSDRYDEAYERYFGEQSSADTAEEPFELSEDLVSKVDERLKAEGVNVSAVEFFDFARKAIEGREYAKFIFTKSVSEILSLVKEIATRYELSKEDASFIDVRTLMNLYATLDHRHLKDILVAEIERNKHFYEFTKIMRLPSLIRSPEDVYEFEMDEGAPNFITLGRVQGEIVNEPDLLTQPLEGKIIMIPSADPGYDWIFTKKLAGLITLYGGANSHMAIRAAELRIPAVIGAGEKNFQVWSKASQLEIDSANKKVVVLQ